MIDSVKMAANRAAPQTGTNTSPQTGKSGLIGSTGFVGQTLLRERDFDACYHSTDIHQIDGQHFDLLICAGVKAVKWYANQHAQEDRAGIDNLIAHLKTVTAQRMVLISTVDVFAQPIGVYEDTSPSTEALCPYGANRLYLEHFVQQAFPHALIVRLPGLVGPGLKKNIIYDLLNHNCLDAVNAVDSFQFYPMRQLNADLNRLIEHKVSGIVHLTAAPVTVQTVAQTCFDLDFTQTLARPAVRYDLRSHLAATLWGKPDYQYSQEESLAAIRDYAQTEPRKSTEAPTP